MKPNPPQSACILFAEDDETLRGVRELGLLRAFAAHPGEVLARDALLDEVWGPLERGRGGRDALDEDGALL